MTMCHFRKRLSMCENHLLGQQNGIKGQQWTCTYRLTAVRQHVLARGNEGQLPELSQDKERGLSSLLLPHVSCVASRVQSSDSTDQAAVLENRISTKQLTEGFLSLTVFGVGADSRLLAPTGDFLILAEDNLW